MYCYLLESSDKRRTYIGATVDVERRLDQHNRKLAGGAKATAGRTWKRVMYVGGFPSWEDTLSFEWAWKYHSKQKGVTGRIAGLLHLISMERCTSVATPFRLWSHNFSLRISTWATPELEKIEIWNRLKSKLWVQSQNNSFLNFQILSFLSFPKMSSSTVSIAQLQELQVLADTMRADILSLNARLAAALGTAAPAPTPAPAEKKKRGPKAKAAEPATEGGAAVEEPKKQKKPRAKKTADAEPPADTEPAAEDKKPRKKREPKVKAVCPTADEGVVRFAGCSDDNEYKVFNNLYRKAFTVDGIEFPSVQHYLIYQKYASTDADYAAKVLAQKNPALLTGMMKSKDHTSRADWDTVQSDLLQKALKAKFTLPELRATLLKTGTAKIEFESATDSYFGIGADGNGTNTLGTSLMTLRATLA
jgi:ribA/ribD-fused uncharacterized protein